MQLVDVQILLESLYNIYLEYVASKKEESLNEFIYINSGDYEFLEEMEYKINEFYSDESMRHKYSSVYMFILQNYDSQSYELQQFIESLDYIKQRDKLNEIAKNKFLKLIDHIELENLKLNNLYRLDTFTTFYFELDSKVNSLEEQEQVIESDFEKTKMELKTIKIDFIGVLSSILSLFTIFGLNSSIIPVLISESKIGICDKILIFIGANIMLGISIFLTLYFIKNMFYEYKLDGKG